MNIEDLRKHIGSTIEIKDKIYELEEVGEDKDYILLWVKEYQQEVKPTVKKKYELSEMSKAYFKNVHPYLVEVITAAITNSPYDFRITAGARTAKEQNALYQIGRTRAGSIVTKADGYRSKSNHQIKSDGYGHAVDIFVCGKYDEQGNYIKFNTTEGYDFKKLKAVADHIKKIAKEKNINVEWGGDWKGGWDSPHFELKL